MATNMATPLATQSPDPAMAKVLGHKYWNHFAIQLGHWNSMKVIIMDDEMFRLIPILVKIEIAREMRQVQFLHGHFPPTATSAHNHASKFLNEEVMFARDADNAKVWILGPKKLIRPNVTVVGNIPIWDPKKKHVPLQEIKIRRPPNAYILYRKDTHNEVKAQNPNLHNNEICKSPCPSVDLPANNFQPSLLAPCGSASLPRSGPSTIRRPRRSRLT
jgi:hypothetical protein